MQIERSSSHLYPIDATEVARRAERAQAIAVVEMILEGRRRDPVANAEWAAESVADGWMTFAGIGAWANQAVGLGMAGAVDGAVLDRLVVFFRERGVEPRIEVASVADPSLISGLAARLFRVREFEHCFARPMALADDPTLDAPLPDGVTIETVDPNDERALRTYVDVATSGFRRSDEPVSEFMLSSTRALLVSDDSFAMLARIDDEPAGGGAMGIRDGVVSLYGTSVVERHRRRGIQSALIAARVRAARERGADLATIHARPGIPTERNAVRAGFSLTYAKAIMVMPAPGLAVSR